MTSIRVLLLLILTFSVKNFSFGVEVFNFSGDGNSAAFLKSSLKLESAADALTICYRIKINRFRIEKGWKLFVLEYYKKDAMAPELSIGNFNGRSCFHLFTIHAH